MNERARRDDRGSAAVELVWLVLLLLMPVIWIVMSVFSVQRGTFAVSSAARSAGRAFVLAPDDVSGERAARRAARIALADQGIDDADIDVAISCTPYPHACHSGTSVITVRVVSRVDLPLLPSVLGGGAPSFRLESSQTVPIGQYREVDHDPAP